MKIILLGIILYFIITQTANEMETCGSARHLIPSKLRYVFPLFFRKMKYASLIDMTSMIWWHLCVYCWVINVIIHQNLYSSYNEFQAVLYISIILYIPISLKENAHYNKWKKKNESVVENLGDLILFSDEDLEQLEEYRKKYIIGHKKGIRISWSVFTVIFTLVCIAYSFSDDFSFALFLWWADSLFIFGCFNIARWRIIVTGEKISYRPTIGRTRNYEIKEIEYCKGRNGVIAMYGKNKRLFSLYLYRNNAVLLLQELKERNILIYFQ